MPAFVLHPQAPCWGPFPPLTITLWALPLDNLSSLSIRQHLFSFSKLGTSSLDLTFTSPSDFNALISHDSNPVLVSTWSSRQRFPAHGSRRIEPWRQLRRILLRPWCTRTHVIYPSSDPHAIYSYTTSRCHRDHPASTSSHPPPARRPTPTSPRHPPHLPPLPPATDTAWTPSSAQSPPSRSSGACGAPARRRPLPQTTPAPSAWSASPTTCTTVSGAPRWSATSKAGGDASTFVAALSPLPSWLW